jgi:hypothetical protein
VSTIQELLGRRSSGSGLEIREYSHRDPSRSSRGTLYSQTLALTSPASGDRSVGIVRSRTQATEFVFFIIRPCTVRETVVTNRYVGFYVNAAVIIYNYLSWNTKPSSLRVDLQFRETSQSRCWRINRTRNGQKAENKRGNKLQILTSVFLCITNARPPLCSSGQSSWLQNGDVLYFLWGTNWIYECICYVEESRPPLGSSGQSSWL